MRIRDAQKRFGYAHQCDSLIASEIVGVKEGIEAVGLVRAHALHQGARHGHRFLQLRGLHPRLFDTLGGNPFLFRTVSESYAVAVDADGGRNRPFS